MTTEQLWDLKPGVFLVSPLGNRLKIIRIKTVKDMHRKEKRCREAIVEGGTVVNFKNFAGWQVAEPEDAQ